MLDPAWIVIDTNDALDLWVFKDPRTDSLRQALKTGELLWVATPAMREELKRVLAYAHIHIRLETLHLSADEVLTHFDALVHIKDEAPRAAYRCKDEDDQKFIDLAVQQSAPLVSKDKCVLTMKNRLKRLGVSVLSEWSPAVQ